jgi:exodeoxyribonuclease V alpha subunit
MSEFNPVKNKPPLPSLTNQEIEQYLASGLFRGIGKKTAAMLVSHWGNETLNILEYSPEQLSQIPSAPSVPYRRYHTSLEGKSS